LVWYLVQLDYNPGNDSVAYCHLYRPILLKN
jgi:hypothetical protein